MKSDKEFVWRDPSCAWRMIDGDVLIVKMKDAGGSRVFTLNKTGAAIWEYADGTRTWSDIEAHIREKFSLPKDADVSADLHSFAKQLKSRELFGTGPEPFSEEVAR